MIGAASLLLALGLGGVVVPVADFDIPYFLNNSEIHAETLRRCHNDVRLAMTPECENAELAGTRRIGRPLPRGFGKSPADQSTKQPPLPKGKERGT
jgi:hypothetical protein